MANLRTKLGTIAWTTVQDIVRRRVTYLVAFLALLILVMITSQLATVTMATDAGETKVVESFHTSVVQQILEMWTFAATFLALYLGASAISSEVAGKTLVNVLSRPVTRATYLAGRWTGLLIFLLAFQVIGVAIAAAAAEYYRVDHTATLWVGCAETVVAVIYMSGVSLGLSTAVPPFVAGGLAWLLKLVPMMVSDWLKHPRWIVRALAHGAYFVAPANMPVDLVGTSFNKELVHPNYALYGQVLGENASYAVVVFALGCAVFARREAKLR